MNLRLCFCFCLDSRRWLQLYLPFFFFAFRFSSLVRVFRFRRSLLVMGQIRFSFWRRGCFWLLTLIMLFRGAKVGLDLCCRTLVWIVYWICYFRSPLSLRSLLQRRCCLNNVGELYFNWDHQSQDSTTLTTHHLSSSQPLINSSSSYYNTFLIRPFSTDY